MSNINKIILTGIFTVVLFSRISASNIELVPLIKFSYDKNLGLTYGFGASIANFKQGLAHGPYTLVSYSREGKGQNLSFGLFSGVGLASFRIGFNRMTIIEGGASKVLWGIEGCPTFFVVHINAGIMTDGDIFDRSKYQLNLSGGAGIF